MCTFKVILMVTLLAGLSCVCSGAKEFKEQPDRMSWRKANRKCARMGGTLVMLKSKEDEDAFKAFAEEKSLLFGWTGVEIKADLQYSYEWADGSEADDEAMGEMIQIHRSSRHLRSQCASFKAKGDLSFRALPCKMRLPSICEIDVQE